MPYEKAIGIIREGAGKHFDPVVVDAFLNAEDEVKRVEEEFSNMSDDHCCVKHKQSKKKKEA